MHGLARQLSSCSRFHRIRHVNESQVKADVNDIINAFCTPDSFKNSSKVITTADTLSDHMCMIKSVDMYTLYHIVNAHAWHV